MRKGFGKSKDKPKASGLDKVKGQGFSSSGGTKRFGGRPVGKQRTRGFMLTIGGIGVVVLGIMGVLSFKVADSVPGRGYYNINAEFKEADNLANHYEVLIGGLRAGQILRPHVKDGKARMLLRLDKKFGPLRDDTKTRVRLRSAVGVRYLELTPGTKGKIIPDGGTLPAANQIPSVPLDEVLGTFDDKTRVGLQDMLSNLGGAAAGNGQNINDALGSGGDFLKDVGSLSTAIVKKKGAIRSLVNGTGRTLDDFDQVRDTIASGFGPTARAASTFADTRPGFKATVTEAPPALQTFSSRLPNVTRLVNAVDGLARDGKPTLDVLPAALRPTSRLLVDARPALSNADRTLNLLRKASPPTTTLLKRLDPELPDIQDLIGSLRPTVDEIEPRQCELVSLFGGWAPEFKFGDRFGSQVNFWLSLFNVANGAPLAGTSSETIPDGQGGNLLDRFNRTAPYPGPCANGRSGSEVGQEPSTVEEQAKGYKYDYTHREGVDPSSRGALPAPTGPTGG